MSDSFFKECVEKLRRHIDTRDHLLRQTVVLESLNKDLTAGHAYLLSEVLWLDSISNQQQVTRPKSDNPNIIIID